MKGYINCMSAHVRRGAARSYHARMTSSPPSPEASGSDADADRLAASSPATPAAELARIAAARPDLHPALAANPATYPDLVDWLRTSPDPAVQTALARRTTPPAQPEPAQAAPAQTEAPAQAEGADAAAPSAKASGTTPRRILRRRPLAIAAAALAVVLVLAVGGAFAWTRTHRGNPTSTPTGAAVDASGAPLSPDWASGSHIAWRIDAYGLITSKSDQVLAIDMSHDGSSDDAFYPVTAFDISSDTPTQQWSKSLPDFPAYWGEYILAGNQVIDPATGNEIAEISVYTNGDRYENQFWIVGDKLIVCDKSDTCTGRSSTQPGTELWRTSRPGLSEDVAHDTGIDVMLYSSWEISVEDVYCNNSTMVVHLGDVFIDTASGQIGSAPDYPSGCDSPVKPTKDGHFTITDPTGNVTAVSSAAYLTVKSQEISGIRLKDDWVDLDDKDYLYLARPDLVVGKMDSEGTITAYAPGRS
mgnify:FL=1